MCTNILQKTPYLRSGPCCREAGRRSGRLGPGPCCEFLSFCVRQRELVYVVASAPDVLVGIVLALGGILLLFVFFTLTRL